MSLSKKRYGDMSITKIVSGHEDGLIKGPIGYIKPNGS